VAPSGRSSPNVPNYRQVTTSTTVIQCIS
jgi:hypothetical protein